MTVAALGYGAVFADVRDCAYEKVSICEIRKSEDNMRLTKILIVMLIKQISSHIYDLC